MRRLHDKVVGSSDLLQHVCLHTRAREVADIASRGAMNVDLDGAFPRAAIEAAKRAKLLSMLIPPDLGGSGATVSDVAEVCFTIAQACASSAMIIAMHHSALACVVRHGDDSRRHDVLLRRVAADESLIASSTTEGNEGGNVRSSSAPLVTENDRVSLERAATVISYGAEADGIVTTARRSVESLASDQALVMLMKEDYKLTETGGWKTLGMRGTRSAGFALKASATSTQVLPVPYKTIHTRTMVPVSHLLWCSVWVGIASSAVARAQAFVRASARRAEGRMPPGGSHFARLSASLGGLLSRLRAALAEFERIRENNAALDAIGTQASFSLLKVEISEGALAVVSMAMRVCGLAGYREDGEFSIARHLRDVLSAPVMIHNERILTNVAAAALMSPAANSLGAR